MRRFPPPLSVTLPPPSSTMAGPVSLRTLAVASRVMVTGAGPQSKVTMPPWATASTTALEVQLAAVPSPITWSGCEVSTAWASAGTAAPPSGLPGGGRLSSGGAVVVVVGGAVVVDDVVAVGPAVLDG